MESFKIRSLQSNTSTYFMARQPQWTRASSLLMSRDHPNTHTNTYTQYDFSGRVISPPAHSEETDDHDASGIRTRNPVKQVATDIDTEIQVGDKIIEDGVVDGACIKQ